MVKRAWMMVLAVVLLGNVSFALAADGGPSMPSSADLLLVSADGLAAQAAGLEAVGEAEPAPAPAGPPLPLHCIEGYSGGAITPMAYICNGGSDNGLVGGLVGMPVASYTFINMGSKKLHVVSATVPLFDRLEFGYAYNRLGLGSLDDDLKKAGLDMGRDYVQLHHFNLRGRLIKEDSFGLPLPEVTAGIHFKVNEGIKQIDKHLGGALKSIGFDRENGVDYTLTASKKFPKLAFGRPVIATAGLRFSKAAQLGYLGFGNRCKLTAEGSIAVLPTDWLLVAYEFRQKNNPYHEIAELIEEEDNWHVVSASWIVNNNLTVSALYGLLGNIANARADCSLGVQVKYEF